MLIRSQKDWELPEQTATPEHIFMNRREIIKKCAAGLIASAPIFSNLQASGSKAETSLYPASLNTKYTLLRPLTPESLAITYNNFYEFGSSKSISKAAQNLKTSPWELKIDGNVERPMTIDAHDLIRSMPLEERLYRLRCVEAWSMRVPWTGFEFSHLIKKVQPKPDTKYVRFETFLDPDIARGQRQAWYPWPYVEGITSFEAMNELTFMVTGLYGKDLKPQSGAPLRLALPWKYGFKSIKSISRITFTHQRPKSFWEQIQSKEYGFWANVNPNVPHRRWSQETERDLESGDRHPTEMWNGYGPFVADMYKNLKDEPLFV